MSSTAVIERLDALQAVADKLEAYLAQMARSFLAHVKQEGSLHDFVVQLEPTQRERIASEVRWVPWSPLGWPVCAQVCFL